MTGATAGNQGDAFTGDGGGGGGMVVEDLLGGVEAEGGVDCCLGLEGGCEECAGGVDEVFCWGRLAMYYVL